MPRSSRMTGISASWARSSESSQPDASVAERRITSTSSSTNVVNASICDFWSRFGRRERTSGRSRPPSVNVSLMFCSLASRQAPSGPTATKPTADRPRRPAAHCAAAAVVVAAVVAAAAGAASASRHRAERCRAGRHDALMLPFHLLVETLRRDRRRGAPVTRGRCASIAGPLCALTSSDVSGHIRFCYRSHCSRQVGDEPAPMRAATVRRYGAGGALVDRAHDEERARSVVRRSTLCVLRARRGGSAARAPRAPRSPGARSSAGAGSAARRAGRRSRRR